MCAVSAVFDNYRTNVLPQQWTPQTFQEFKTIISMLDALDKKLDQKDCHDPSKALWMKEVEKRLSQLESK